ncbi:hypothetical protein EVAR_73086_1, partial [Eumeta japonica]
VSTRATVKLIRNVLIRETLSCLSDGDTPATRVSSRRRRRAANAPDKSS